MCEPVLSYISLGVSELVVIAAAVTLMLLVLAFNR